jgi:pimeloyl-ACP methyl ester carboxylesterase
MSSSLHAVSAGHGAPLLLVHGSAADHATWTIQLASGALRARFTMTAYDRRVAGASVVTVEEHAADLADLAGGPVFVCGSSFGAVICLELARQRPERVRGMVLCEPPLPPDDDAPGAPAGMLEELDAIAAEHGGEAAAEKFLRTVLGDPAFERMPRLFQARATAQWPAIRSDCHALGRYRVRYAELPRIDVPALLLAGERSAGYFRPTVEALAAALPRARLETLTGAGHMMHADAHRSFAERLIAFADTIDG